MPTFRHDAIEFHYEQRGDGRPFCFQHGLGGDVTQPFTLFRPPSGVRLLAFDARGHGQTRPLGDPDKLTFQAFGEDLAAFLEHLGLTRVVLGGISMGASLSLHFALRWPEKVAALVLSRPAWLETASPYNVKMFSLISRLIREQGPEPGLAEFQRSPEYKEAVVKWPDAANSFSLQFTQPRSADTAIKLERIIRDAPHPERQSWSTVAVPTLVLGNRLDPVHPFEFAEELAGAIPGAELREVTSKSLSLERHTADVQEALEKFLTSLASSRNCDD